MESKVPSNQTTTTSPSKSGLKIQVDRSRHPPNHPMSPKTATTTTTTTKQSTIPKIENIHALYDIQELIGEGAFGKVYRGVRRLDAQLVAIKAIPQYMISNDDLERERIALAQLSTPGHDHVCRLYDQHQDDVYFYLIMEHIAGGELFEHLCRKGPFSEQEAAKFLLQFAKALAYLHSKGFVHADLKPENLMMDSWDCQRAKLKIVDFGFSVPYIRKQDKDDNDDDENTTTTTTSSNNDKEEANGDSYQTPQKKKRKLTNGDAADDNNNSNSSNSSNNNNSIVSVKASSPSSLPLIFGTIAYLPPELALRCVTTPPRPTPAVDMYAAGLIMYTTLTGTHPFDPSNRAPDDQIARAIFRTSIDENYLENFVFDDERTRGLSSSSMMLMKKLLHPDPQQRMSAVEFQNHPWILGKTASNTVLPHLHTKLEQFWQKRFRAAILKKFGIGFRLSEDDMRIIYEIMDLNGDGKVSLGELKFALSDLLGNQNMMDILSSVDVRDNGVLDFDEFKSIMRKNFDDDVDDTNGKNRKSVGLVRQQIIQQFTNGDTTDLSRDVLREIFDSMDLNNDGTVQLSEAIQVIRQRHDVDEEAISAWADKTDTDLDGNIDFEEFCSAMLGVK